MDDLNVKVAEIEARSKSNMHRIDKLEKRQDELDSIVRSVAVLAKEQEYTKTDVAEIKTDVAEIKTGINELKAKPGKRWDAVVDKVLLAVIGAIVVYVLSKIGF